MAFPKLDALKWVTSTVVGLGAGKVVKQIIQEHAKPDNVRDKVAITAATWVISGIVTTAAKKYTEQSIDDAVALVGKGIDWYKTSEKLSRINRGETDFEKEGLDQTRFRKNDNGKWVRISEEDWQHNQGTAEEPVEAAPIVRKLGDDN